MRVLFSSLASPGHTYPLIPLARAAQDAGHQVRFATSPSVHPTLIDLGLTPVPAGIELAEAFGRLRKEGARPPGELPAEDTMHLGRRVFGEVMPLAFAPDVIAAIDDFGPDLVIKELGNSGAGIAAQVRRVPAITHGFGLVAPGSGGRSPFVATEGLLALAAEHGLDELRPPSAEPYVDLCPPGLRDPAAPVPDRPVRVPLRPSAFRTPGLTTDLDWRDGRRLVYLTLGTAFGSVAVLRRAIEGLSRLELAVLVATGPSIPPEDLGVLPENVRAETWVQQAEVLAQATVVVHHGGSGTTLGATAAGALQLLLPQGADQFVNTGAVVRAGAGLSLERADLSPDAVVDRVGRLLDGRNYRVATDRLAAEVASMPSPDDVAARLPELLDLAAAG